MNATVRRICLGLIGVLYVLSVPWYRAPDAAPPLWFGLPNWVAVAVGCYVAIACLNAVAWTITPVPDEPAPSDGRSAGGRE